jgi:hypothetical protein
VSPRRGFHEALVGIDAERRAFAQRQYGEIYAHLYPVTPQLQALLDRPSVKAGYQKALRRAQDAGEQIHTVPGPTGELVPAPTLANLDRVKQGLDAFINDNTDAITGKLNSDARSALIAKQHLLDYIESADPKIGALYREARSTYAGYSALENAMQKGRRVFTGDAEQLRAEVGQMGEAEREAFKLGAFNAVRDEIESVKATGNAGSRAKFNTEKFRRRLAVAFASDKELDDFLDAVDREGVYASTRGMVAGGSPTARIQADQAAQRAESGAFPLSPDASLYGTLANLTQRAWSAGAPSQPLHATPASQLTEMLLGRQPPASAIPNDVPRSLGSTPSVEPWEPGPAPTTRLSSMG